MYTTRVKQKYQVTLPKEVRKDLGINEDDEIAFLKVDAGYIVQKVDPEKIRDFLLIDTKPKYETK